MNDSTTNTVATRPLVLSVALFGDQENGVGEKVTSAEISESIETSRTVGFEFLLTDSKLAQTMLDRAVIAADSETRARNIANATRARDAIRNLMSRLQLDENHRAQLEEALRSLEARLASFQSRD